MFLVGYKLLVLFFFKIHCVCETKAFGSCFFKTHCMCVNSSCRLFVKLFQWSCSTECWGDKHLGKLSWIINIIYRDTLTQKTLSLNRYVLNYVILTTQLWYWRYLFPMLIKLDWRWPYTSQCFHELFIHLYVKSEPEPM